MHGEDFLINDCRDGQTVEAVCESFPQFDIIAPLAFVVKTIYTVNRRTLVISPKDEEVFRVLDLVGQEQADCL